MQVTSFHSQHGRVFFINWSFKNTTETDPAEIELSVEFVRITIAKIDFHDGREFIAINGRKTSGIESYILDKIYIQNADRPSGRTLIREMIDIGNFDVVDIKGIFHWITASHDQVIALIIHFGHAGQRHHDAAHIAG